MNVWLKELSEMVKMLLGNPSSLFEYVILGTVVVLVLFLAMYMVGSAMRIPNLGIVRRTLALIVSIGFLMCAWYGVQEYLLPRIEVTWLRYGVMIGVPMLACLVVVIPIQQVIFRSSYVATLITFVVSIALAGLFVILTNAVLVAVVGGENDSRFIRDRRDSINKVIGD